MRIKHAAIFLLAIFLLLMAFSNRAYAQDTFPVDTTKLAERADETTTVSLDKNMLQFASRFLSSNDEDREARRIIANLDGIYVRTFEFKTPNAYSASELEAFRRPFAGPEWSHIVSVHGKEPNEDTDIYVRLVNGEVRGMFILAAEKEELTFVHILGPIKPEDLDQLSGNFGIPKRHGAKQQPRKEDEL
jgi:hypothetical protein